MDFVQQIQSGDIATLRRLSPKELRDITVQDLSGKEIVRLCQDAPIFNQKVCSDPNIWTQLFKRDVTEDPTIINQMTPQEFRQEYLRLFLNEIENDEMADTEGYEIKNDFYEISELGYEKFLNTYVLVDGSDRTLFLESDYVEDALKKAIQAGHYRMVISLFNYLLTFIMDDLEYIWPQPFEDLVTLAQSAGHEDILEFLQNEKDRLETKLQE